MAHITKKSNIGGVMSDVVKMTTDKGQEKWVDARNSQRLSELDWGYAIAPTTAPSVQTAKPAIEDVNKNIGTLDNTLEFYQEEGSPTIYKDKEMTKGFQSEKEFTDAGGTPYWKPGFEGVSNVRQIKPTGDIVNDRRIAEVNQTISETPELFSTGYEPTLLEIYEARQDVKDEVERLYPGQNPTIQGTEANTWLNDWYNQYGKAEGADMVRQGILRPKTDTGTPAIDTTEVINAQDAVDDAIRAASEARDSEDYIAFKEAMEDLKASRATLQTNLDTLYADQKKFRDQYLESLKPTIAETDLQNQLLNIRAEIDQTALNAQAGINKVSGQAIPQGFVTGQSKAIADAANLTLQTQGIQEKNLIDRLGIEVGKRKATTEALAAGLGFIGEDLNMQMKIQNRLDNQEQNLLDRFEDYEDKQREEAVTILTALAGIDPNTLSPEALTKLAQIAQQLGISLPDILAGLQLQFDQVSFENALMLAKLTPEEKELDTQIVTAGGRKLLVNKQTGQTIRDLGGAYKTGGGGGSGGGGGGGGDEPASQYDLSSSTPPDAFRIALEEANQMSISTSALQEAWDEYRSTEEDLTVKGKPNKDKIGSYIQRRIGEGAGWGEIAEELKQKGIPTYEGSEADKMLNKMFGGGEDRTY